MSNKVSIHIKGNTERREDYQPEPKVICGRYAVEKELGRGGIGEVSLAQDLQLERMVAVKRILVQMGSSEQRSQFAIDEAKRLARLQHPNIVTVFDVLDDGGDLLMVMEYLSGYTLGDLQSPLTIEDFINVARQCLSGLAAAHALGMIHLDIKSSNIMLTWLATGQLQVKILDFGLATMLGQATSLENEDGSVLGSVYTMAPEQLMRETVDVRTDLYSLGCVFYHSLTGKDPFRGSTVEEIMDAHLRHDLRPLSARRPDLPPAVSDWVETLMSKSPEDRPPDATSALKALVAALSAGRGGSDIKNLRLGNRGDSTENVEEITLPALSQLQACLGKSAAVHGIVERVWENMPGTVRFLNFETVQHNEFSVVLVLKENHPEFAKERLNELIGKKIRVTGRITEFHGSPQVVVESPSQIAPV
jgi:serine/threonine protein kinase